ncbi:MAG: DegQ family serine endoprotease [Betaproteobacteria bacterium]|nr:MAG: DegQ family serine endoprotease [Betaproteobacteria bacterium]
MATAVVAAMGAGVFTAGHWFPQEASAAAPLTASSRLTANAPLPDFTGIVERNGPAVVNISVTHAGKTAANMPQFKGLDPDSPFYEFFRQFRGAVPHGGQPDRGIEHGQGSGFIVSSDGVILTNAHVIADASEVTVKLTDRREYRAKVIGSDKPSDVAVLKIDATGLPTVKIGSSASEKVGEWVLAIGSPFGFENSVTSGIVSAKSRSLPDGTYIPFIQTDVAVNPGNSGGPLFNMKGEVIGINAQIFTHSGGYQGLSFAVPIDLAVKVKDQLQQFGKVSRGRIGVTIQEVNQQLADSFGLKTPGGALVASVEENGPAAKAGVKAGDVILKFNGHVIARSSELPGEVADIKPGAKATLEISRNGSSKEIEVTVGELKGAKLASADTPNQEHGRLGLDVRPLNPDERAQAGAKGLVVEQASGPAARAGIQPGDLLLAVNGTPIQSVAQLRALVEKSGNTMALLIQRNDGTIFVPVDLSHKQG